MQAEISRRTVLAAGAASILAGTKVAHGDGATPAAHGETTGAAFICCLNTATIMGHRIALPQAIELAAKAGYSAMEPWIREIEAANKAGVSCADLRKRFADNNVTVEGAVGFAQWIVDNEAQRNRGLEQMKRDMDLVAQIGGKRIAAPPIGATDQANFDLAKAAGRYRALVDLGEKMGVIPQIEIWGHSKVLGKLGEAAFVAAECGHPKACILPDVYHMYKADSQFSGIRMLSAQAVQVLHINDYPADPPRATIRDEHRIYPGDGIAPLAQILRDLAGVNPRCVLSLELFNREYWKKDALEAARIGAEKIRSAAAKALSGLNG